MGGNKGAPFRGFSIYARDVDRLARFYRDVLGWNRAEIPTLFGPTNRPEVDDELYNRMTTGAPGEPTIGITTGRMIGSYRPDGQVWHGAVLYFAVPDIEAAVATAVEHGARLDIPPTQLVERGWVAHLVDPEGNAIGFWQAPADWAGDAWSRANDFHPTEGWVRPTSTRAAPEEFVPTKAERDAKR
jgi:predicted enzyme related to lactoylglutathione lyase